MRAIIFLLGIAGICSAIDVESSKEGECLSPAPKTVPIDFSAFAKTPILYLPLMSKYAAVRSAEELMGKEKLKDVSEEDIKKSCMVFVGNNTYMTIQGFNGLVAHYDLNPEAKNSLVWKMVGSKEWSAESWVTKVGKDYFVAVDCWSPGLKSFGVNSVKKTLSAEDKSEITEHLKALGFKTEDFYEFNYDKCP